MSQQPTARPSRPHDPTRPHGHNGSTHRARTEDTAELTVQSHRFCPGCGTELVDRGCKMRCTRCGFFLDCSDG